MSNSTQKTHTRAKNAKNKLTDKEFQDKLYEDRDLEREYWKSAQPQRLTERQWLEVFPEAQEFLEYRLAWIRTKIEHLIQRITKVLQGYAHNQSPYFLRLKESVAKVFWGFELDELDKEEKKIERLLYPPEVRPGQITDEMIEQARSYPFTNLIDVTRKGMISCPFHEETTASFYIKNNWGYCFGCKWHGDTIQFVMETEGLSFPDAVKRLQ